MVLIDTEKLRQNLQTAVDDRLFGTTLVGRFFDMTDKSDREAFVEWYCDVFDLVNKKES